MNRVAGLAVGMFLGLASLSCTAQPTRRIELTPATARDWVGGGPPGGDVCTVLVDRRSPETIYAGIERGGVFKSTDGGASWTTASAGLPWFAGCPLEIDPASPGTLYAEVLGRIYKTTDRGANWMLTDSGLPDAELPVVAPGHTDTLYVVTAKGLFKSVNAGKTWSRGTLPHYFERPEFSLRVDPINAALIYAVGANGVSKSYDGARSWIAIDSGLSGVVVALAIDPAHSATLYAAGTHGVFKSTTGGHAWFAANAGLSGVSLESIVIDPSNSATVYAANSGGIFKSVDAGGSWRLITSGSGLETALIRRVTVDPTHPSVLFAGTDSGVFKSTDGGNVWVSANSGLTRLGVGDLTIVDSVGQTVLAASSTGVVKTVDGGVRWTRVEGLPHGRVKALTGDRRNRAILFAWIGERLYESANAGATWADTGAVRDAVKGEVSPLVDFTNPAVIWVAIPGAVLYRTHPGTTWERFRPRLPQPTAITAETWIDPTDPRVLFAAAFFQGLHRSADGGKTWNKIAGIPRLPSGYSLFFDVDRPGIVYLRTYGTYIESSEGDIYKSIDGGQSWTMVRIGSTSNVPIDFFALAPSDPPVLFAGAWSHYVNDSSFRLLKSTDGGGSWQEARAGLPSEDASALSIAAVPDNPSVVYVSISGRGVFKSTNGGASWLPTGSR